jgi:putative transposase
MQRTIQRSVEIWRELVARQDRSGLSVQAFCRQERLNVWTFYGWRFRLRKSTAVAEDRVVAREQNKAPAGFIDLGALTGASSRCEIRLDLGGGIVLQVVRG